MQQASELLQGLVEIGVTGWKAVVVFSMACFAWPFHEWLSYKKQLKEKE